MNDHDQDRRHFLCVLGCAGAAAAAAPGCGEEAPPSPPFTAGRVAEHPQGLWKIYRAQKVAVGRDAMGYFAFSLLCPHEGYDVTFRMANGDCMGTAACTAASTMGSFVCESGHGGTFDGNGARTGGPPMRGLTHYQVTVSAGTITVNPGVTVADTARSMG